MNSGDQDFVKINDISAENQWINLRAKVVQLWDSPREMISQVGLIGDETGTIKFTKWAIANLPDLMEGKSYELRNVVTDYWNERYNVKLNRNSQIFELEEDIEVGRSEIEIRGALVSIQVGSGLILRCPTCNRMLTGETCAEHGKVEGKHDLRVKAILDDGKEPQDILLNREITEDIIGIGLEGAILEGADVVLEGIKRKLIGRYYDVKGPRVGRYILVQEIERWKTEDEDLNDLVKALGI
jgi:replication factor A1